MPDISNILINQFKSGWCPSDDPINGRKDAFLQMDNVELDANGAVSLIGGTAVKYSGYPANAHTIYSRMLNTSRMDYAALTDGSIYRNSTALTLAGGDATNAAFGSAFNYVLACSGNKRLKDNGTTSVNLGVGAPTVAPTFVNSGMLVDSPYQILGSLLANTVMYTGTSSVVTETHYPSGAGHARPANIQYLQLTADTSGVAICQTYNGSGDPHDSTILIPPSGSNNGTALDDDVIPFYGYVTSPWGCSLQLDILLSAGNAYADQMPNYYTFLIEDLATLNFDPGTGAFYTYIKRSDFQKIGAGDWNTTYGFRITFKGSNGQVINILGNSLIPATASNFLIFGGSHSQNGVYQFVQVNVNNTGSYLALSSLGPLSSPIAVIKSQVLIVPQNPATVDAQVNEVWIFARSTGGPNAIGDSSNLNVWYRVARRTSSLGSSFYIEFGDLEAITLNIRYNLNLVSIASSGISDKILSIVGPINGRWYYFTSSFMYPSDINNPDLVDTSIAIRTTGSDNEIMLWAFEVAEGVVLVGTSVNVYILSGTFATLPDFTVDIYYRGLGCKYPPITYDAAVFSGEVVYLASDGWRTINSGGENRILVAPNLDLLYRNKSRYDYTGVNLKITPGSVRYPVCIGKNKLWCFITNTGRCEVYDFIRQYWRTFNYQLGDVTATYATQDGQIIAFYSGDKKLREVDISSSKLIDGTSNQTIKLLFPIQDGGTPKQRKDSCTFKIRMYTGVSGSLQITCTKEDYTADFISTGATSSAALNTQFYDMSQLLNTSIAKTYQIKLTGQVADFLMDDIEILYTLRPPQVSFLRILNNNFGTAARKRLRTWPHVIDTLGNNVIVTPSSDNINQPTDTWNTSHKDTKRYYFKTDVTGVDYGLTLYCPSGLFEYFGELNPEIVQVYPVAKRFDQVGPEELFRFGKVLKLRMRLLAVGGTTLPYTIYFQDAPSQTNNLTVLDGRDSNYEISMPKGVMGNIMRIELGPTNFDFHRFYAQLLIDQAGIDTDNRWITVQ